MIATALFLSGCALRSAAPLPDSPTPSSNVLAGTLTHLQLALPDTLLLDAFVFDGLQLRLVGENVGDLSEFKYAISPPELFNVFFADTYAWPQQREGSDYERFLLTLSAQDQEPRETATAWAALETTEIHLDAPQYAGASVHFFGLAASADGLATFERAVRFSPCLMDVSVTPTDLLADTELLAFELRGHVTGSFIQGDCTPTLADDGEALEALRASAEAAGLAVTVTPPDPTQPTGVATLALEAPWETLWPWLRTTPMLPVERAEMTREEEGLALALSLVVRQPVATRRDARALSAHAESRRDPAAGDPDWALQGGTALLEARDAHSSREATETYALLGKEVPKEPVFLGLLQVPFGRDGHIQSLLNALDTPDVDRDVVTLLESAVVGPYLTEHRFEVSATGEEEALTAYVAAIEAPDARWEQLKIEGDRLSGQLVILEVAYHNDGPQQMWEQSGRVLTEDAVEPAALAASRDPFRGTAEYETLLNTEPETIGYWPLQEHKFRHYQHVGSLQTAAEETEPRALIRAPDGRSHVARLGDTIGHHWARVTDITPEAVTTELAVRNASGDIEMTDRLLPRLTVDAPQELEVSDGLPMLNHAALSALRQQLAEYNTPISLSMNAIELTSILTVLQREGLPISLDPALEERALSISMRLMDTPINEVFALMQVALLDDDLVLGDDLVLREDAAAAAALRGALWQTHTASPAGSELMALHLSEVSLAELMSLLRVEGVASGAASEGTLTLSETDLTYPRLLSLLAMQLRSQGYQLTFIGDRLVAISL